MDLPRLLGALALIAGSALAQTEDQAARLTTPSPLELPRIPVHTAPDDMGQPYGTWAAGADYKASFHGDMTFVPYLGADYPVSRPWSWRTVSVRVGERELLVESREPERHEFDYRYEYDHGAITEAYDVRRDGLEQTFVLDRPQGRGDLVIRGQVKTDLVTTPTHAAHQKLEFRDPAGRTILTYGAAVVVDAAGDCQPITTTVEGDMITLRVPSAWLRTAAYPIVVDPLLATQTLMSSGQNYFFHLDIGHDDEASTNNTIIAASRNVGSFETDLYVYITNEDFSAGLTPIFTDITSSWRCRTPSCGYVGGADRWTIVFTRGFTSSGRRLIRAHLHDSGSAAFSTSVSHQVLASPFNANAPKVGGVAAWDNGTEALVVFEREDNTATAGAYNRTNRTEVHGMLLGASTGSFGSPFLLDGGGSTDCQNPCVTRFRTDGSEWVTAFSLLLPSGGTPDWEVRGRKVGGAGTPSTALWSSPQRTNDAYHEFTPAIDGRDGRYLISFTGSASGPTPAAVAMSGEEIWAQRVDWGTGSATPPTSLPAVMLDSGVGGSAMATDVAYDWTNQSMFVVEWELFIFGSGNYAARIGYDGIVTEGPLTLTNGQLGFSGCVFDGTTRRTLFAWAELTSMRGRLMDYASAVPWTAAGSTCSSTIMRWVGAQQIGTETGRINAINNNTTNVPLHFLMCSLAPASQPVPHPAVLPTCKLLVDNVNGYLGLLNLGVGNNVIWNFPIPSWVDPVTFYFQDWMLDGTQFEGSNRLTVPVVK